MPYEVRRVNGGWKVFKQGTMKSFSKSPQTREEANAQMRALYAQEGEELAEKVTQASVHFRRATPGSIKRCGNCTMDRPPISCTLVQSSPESPIEAGDVCDRFYPKRK